MRYPPMYRPKPPMRDGVLLPKITAHEQRRFPRLCAQLCLSCLPDGLTPPLRLHSVQASGLPTWTAMQLRIPLCVQGADRCGKTFFASSVLEMELCLPKRFWQNPLFVPCVELLCSREGCECIPVELCMTLECYCLCLEPWPMCKPACPDLPLYPPPITPPSGPRCPTIPGPCGWPAPDSRGR